MLLIKKHLIIICIFILVEGIRSSIPAAASPFEHYSAPAGGHKKAAHKHNELSYQQPWCSAHKGVMEYKNNDYTRIDCLTDTHAVEFDFSNKWKESIGQALHYEYMTRKRAKVILILDGSDWQRQLVYYERVKAIGLKHNFDVEYITDDILKLNKQGKCKNPKCKCQKNK